MISFIIGKVEEGKHTHIYAAFLKRNVTSKCSTQVRRMFLIKLKMCSIVYKHEIQYSKSPIDELWHKH